MLEFFKLYSYRLLNWVFPKQCIMCNDYGKYICNDCRKKYIHFQKTQVCHVCKQQTSVFCHSACRHKTNLSGVIVCLKYNKFIEKLVAEIKYNLYRDVLSAVLPFYINSLKRLGLNFKHVIFVPVPLHRRRLWERGFNQSELIATSLSSYFNSYCYNLLKRRYNTKHQVGLKREQRMTNLINAFDFNSKFKDFNLDKNKTIILVDDVMTTGSTLEQSAKVLKRHGFKYIYAIVLARG